MYLKPRLRFSRQTWDCGVIGSPYPKAYGFGYSPKAAYDDWLIQFNRYRLYGGS